MNSRSRCGRSLSSNDESSSAAAAEFAMWAAIRYFRGLDELQRRIQFEGLAFSFVASCFIALTWGFLQNAGLPHADIAWVAPLLIFLWGVGACLAKRRYQ
jgi:hypothetical protein